MNVYDTQLRTRLSWSQLFHCQRYGIVIVEVLQQCIVRVQMVLDGDLRWRNS